MIAEKLRQIYASAQVEAVYVECDFLRRYLTGFYSTDGYVILTAEKCVFYADLRYFEAAKKALQNSAVEVVEGGCRDAEEALKAYRTVGIPFPFVSATSYKRLQDAGFLLVDCMPALQEAMIIKSEYELSCIARACDVAEEAYLALLSQIKEGMTEIEVSALLEYNMRARGAEGVSFDTICAFGANGSVPHHATGNTKLKFGDAILLDFGCKIEGYCSDITRTLLFGDDKKHGEFKKVYEAVLGAHERVKECVVAGMSGREADAIARDFLHEKGYGKYFTHSLGHGIGLQIHETPNLSPRSEHILQNGMVFSNEPGVYLEGELGVRIEDSVMLKDGKIVSFMKKSERNLIIL